jgi:hypothetical protein
MEDDAAKTGAGHRVHKRRAPPRTAARHLPEPAENEPAVKLTKQLALDLADTIELSALAPHEELHPNDVRAIAEGLYEGQLDSFQFGMLTDWAYTIAEARLNWRRRRGRPASKLLVL